MTLIRENLDYEASQLVPGLVQDVIYLTAVLNSCVNPVIYGMYYYRSRQIKWKIEVAPRIKVDQLEHLLSPRN